MGGMNRAGGLPFWRENSKSTKHHPLMPPPKKKGISTNTSYVLFFWGGVLLRKRALKGGTPLDSHDIKAARILCCFMFFLAGSKIPPTKQICCSDLEAAAGAGCLTWPRCRESPLRDVRSQRTRGVEGVGNRVKPSWSQVDGRPFQHSLWLFLENLLSLSLSL